MQWELGTGISEPKGDQNRIPTCTIFFHDLMFKIQAYKKMTMELQRVDLEKISRDEKLAFFINIYNALVVHGNIEKGIPKNTWQR